MKTNKLNWLNIGKGYESIRLILNKKKVEAMGFNKVDNNEVTVEYDIENQTITIKPSKKIIKQNKSNIASLILSMKGNFTLEDVIKKVKSENTNYNVKEIKEKLNTLCEYGLIEQTDLYYFSY